jgi:hypothetical protein
VTPARIGSISKPHVSSSYTGPLDLVPGLGKAGWSQRALLAAWTDPVIAIRKSGGTLESFAATDEHEVDVAAVLAHLGGSAGLIDTFFDQCGAGVNLVNVGPDFQFNWSQSVNSGEPGIGGNGSGVSPRLNSFEQNAFTWQSGDAFTYFRVFYFGADDTIDSTSGDLYIEADGGNISVGIYCSAASPEIWVQTAEDFTSFSVDASRSDFNGRHILEVHFDAAGNPSILLDGVAIGTTLATGSVMPVPTITDGAVYITLPYEAADPPTSDSWLHEAFIVKNASAGQRLSVRQNLQAFFGTPALP